MTTSKVMLRCSLNENFLKLSANVVKYDLVSTRAPFVNIAIKCRLRKWRSGDSQIKFLESNMLMLFCVNRQMLFGWHRSTTYANRNKIAISKKMLWSRRKVSCRLLTFERSRKLQNAVWLAPSANIKEHDNKRLVLHPRRFTGKQYDFWEP